MKKFQFALENLLQHRRHLEERERTKFSRIRGDIVVETDHRQRLRASQSATELELAARMSEPFVALDVLWFSRYLERLKLQIERSTERIAALEKELEAQKQIMIGATRNRKIIENLRKKKEREYQVASDREEQKSVDELVVVRFGSGH